MNFLDTKSYLLTIPQVNSFFYFLVKDSKNYRTSLKLRLDIYYSKSTSYKNTIKIIKINNNLQCVTEYQQLEKLELNLVLSEMKCKLKFESILNLDIFFASIISLSTIKKLRINTNGKSILQVKNL